MKAYSNNLQNSEPPTSQQGWEWAQLLLENFVWIALCIALSLGAAEYYLSRTKNLYEGKAVLEVQQKERRLDDIQEPRPDELKVERIKTIEQKLKNRGLLRDVLSKEKLFGDPLFENPELGKRYNENEDLNLFEEMLDVRQRRGTRLIDITITHTSSQMAQRLAAAIVRVYMNESIEQRLGTTDTAVRFLHNEAEKLGRKLNESEQALQAYKEKSQSVSLEERQNIVVTKLKELSSKLTDAKTARLKLHADFLQVQQTLDPELLLAIPMIVGDTTVMEFSRQVAQQQTEIANLAQRYKNRHPKMEQAQSKLVESRSLLRDAALKARQSSEAAYQKALAMEQTLGEALSDQEKTALELSRKAISYNALNREFEADRALYETVLKRLKESEVVKGIDASEVRIVESATSDGKPVFPRKGITRAMSLAGGLGIGIVLVLWIGGLNSCVKTVDRAEEWLNLPVLAAIPRFKRPLFRRKSPLPILDAPHSAAAEAFRSMRTSLALLNTETAPGIVLFTSATPGEGKTFCSANHAVGISKVGRRTLLIEADLRRPRLSAQFKRNTSEPGLMDYLVGNAELASIAVPTACHQLWFMTAGTPVKNPAEWLAGPRFRQLLEECRHQYEAVIIDSAPLLSVSDTLLMVAHVHTTCMVVDARKTPRRAVCRAINLLGRAQVQPAGVILNNVPLHNGLSYYYHYEASANSDYRKVYA